MAKKVEKINVGDIVYLIAGSKPMTVIKINYGNAECAFDIVGTASVDSFKLNLLTKIKPGPPLGIYSG